MRVEYGIEPDEVDPTKIFDRFLDSVGDGSGTKDMSTTADEYFFTPTQYAAIGAVEIWYTDGGAGTNDEFGNLNGALSNGIQMRVLDTDGSTVLHDMLNGITVKTNGDWFRYAHSARQQDFAAGSTNVGYAIEFNFISDYGWPLTLKPGQSFSVNIQDSLAGLAEMYVQVKGYYID